MRVLDSALGVVIPLRANHLLMLQNAYWQNESLCHFTVGCSDLLENTELQSNYQTMPLNR